MFLPLLYYIGLLDPSSLSDFQSSMFTDTCILYTCIKINSHNFKSDLFYLLLGLRRASDDILNKHIIINTGTAVNAQSACRRYVKPIH